MKHLVAIFALLVLCGQLLQADEEYLDLFNHDGCHRLYAGPQVYYVNYKANGADSTAAGLVGLDNPNTKLTGCLYGGNVGYEYKKPWGVYANAELNYGTGNLKKHDHLTRDVFEYDAFTVVGYQLGGSDCDCWSATAYAGSDYLTQNFDVKSLHTTYRYYIYRIPVGIDLEYQFMACDGRWSIGIDAMVLPQIDSTVKLTPLRGARWVLSKRTDWIIDVPIQYFSGCWPIAIKLDLFWKRVGIGGSKAVSPTGVHLGLPPSTWNALGGALDVIYEF